MAKKAAKRAKKKAAKRELIKPSGDKRYVRRGAKGQFKESDDVGRSSAQDQQRDAKHPTRSGQGDRGDREGSDRDAG